MANNNCTTNQCINSSIDAWFLTGFSYAEGSFIVTIYQNKDYKLGWLVQAIFSICLHNKDLPLLKKIQSYFDVGTIIIYKHNNSAMFRVGDQKQLMEVIIPHFAKYPLLTKKRADFLLFKSILKMILNKDHLKIEGLNKIVSIRASMNDGLSKIQMEFFPNIIPVDRPVVETQIIPNSALIAGFSAGESCFDIKISKQISINLGYQTQLRFRFTQHVKDKALIWLIASYLNCGTIYISRSTVDFYVSNFNDIINIIIPFFDKYPIQGTKYLDYMDFCKVAELMQKKEHLTHEGLEKIRQIKSTMNTRRDHNWSL